MNIAQANVPKEAIVPDAIPEFRRIILDFSVLKDRLSVVGLNAAHIRDKLIGAKIDNAKTALADVDDCAKPTCFTAECFDVIMCFKCEIERLEGINSQMLKQIEQDEIGETR